jgi:isoleucyl-tRNA synthetase
LIEAELRVRAVTFGEIEGATVRAKPDLPSLGPKLGKELPVVRQALADGNFELLDSGRVVVLGHDLAPEEVFIERSAPEGFSLAEAGGLVVALDTRVDDELALEGRALDVIHELQRMRRDAGLELTDRIEIRYAEDDLGDVFEKYGERIAGETLAVKVEVRVGDRLAIAKAS